MRGRSWLAVGAGVLGTLAGAGAVEGKDAHPARVLAEAGGLGPLGAVPVPRPTKLADFVRDEQAAIALGKALFWDVQLGSDGQACASCHFHAGADDRTKNQLNPGMLRVADPSRAPAPGTTFGDELGVGGSGGQPGPNYTLVAEDFPFHRLEDEEDRMSCLNGLDDDTDGRIDAQDPDCYDTDDISSSQGAFSGGFVSVARSRRDVAAFDVCSAADTGLFHVGGIATRKVEPRNSPTVINAVFNHRNFWDGRASDLFNGLNPFGERGLLPTATNARPGTLKLQPDGTVRKVQVRLNNASLASQASGPPNSDFEMACGGRTFADIGRKLRTRAPLAGQSVHPQDSVLGAYARPGRGMRGTYQTYIQRAFDPAWWSGGGRYDATGELVAGSGGYTQLEVNFSLFFSLSVQLYEATLVSDDTPFDRFMEGDDRALGPVEQFGLEVFLNEGKCSGCHAGSEFTGASVSARAAGARPQAIERMLVGDGAPALYDGGFYNIGASPTAEDLGLGVDILGFPLSFSRQATLGQTVDAFVFTPDGFDLPGPIVPEERVAVDGAFKTPTLRNVELTGPYFHHGGAAALREVVTFYDRGGDRLDVGRCDTTGFGGACSNLDADLVPLGLANVTRTIDGVTVNGEEALVRFMVALTDDRVRYERAPFDHPSLRVTDGHPGDATRVKDRGDGRATGAFRDLPAVGASGIAQPIGTFLGLDPMHAGN